MGGKGVARYLAPSGSGREHARHLRERRLRRRPRDRQRSCRGLPSSRSVSMHPAEVETPRRGRARRSPSCSRSTSRRRQRRCRHEDDGTLVLALLRGDDRLEEASSRPRSGPTSGRDRRRDRGGLRRRGRLARSRCGSSARSSRTRRSRGAVRRRGESHRLASARRRGGPGLPAGVRRHPPAEGGRCVPGLRRAARLPDRDRGGAYLQARHALLRGVPAPSTWTRTASRSDRDGLLRHRARAASSRPRSSSTAATRDGLAGGDLSLRRARGRAGLGQPELVAIGDRSPRASRRRAWTSCSTTASCARARSSPTPT
jgi:hypothetical protein